MKKSKINNYRSKPIEERSEKSIKQSKSINDKLQFDDIDGDNARIIAHQLELGQLPFIDLDNASAVAERTALYFQMCSSRGVMSNIPEYAVALGVDRPTLQAIHDRKDRTIPQTVLRIIDKGYAIINAQMESLMIGGKINPVSAIFLMKNNMGYTNEDHPAQDRISEKTLDKNKLVTEYLNQLPEQSSTDDDDY